jgi:hypothetical protein
MAIAVATVAASIDGLTISGVTIRDLDEIPEKVEPRDCPVLYPNPDGFMSGVELEVDSFGSASAKKTIRYRLNYVFLHSPVGGERGLFAKAPDMVAKVCAILDAVIANDAISGCVDIQPGDVTEFGPVADPSGNVFHGCRLAFAVTELVN